MPPHHHPWTAHAWATPRYHYHYHRPGPFKRLFFWGLLGGGIWAFFHHRHEQKMRDLLWYEKMKALEGTNPSVPSAEPPTPAHIARNAERDADAWERDVKEYFRGHGWGCGRRREREERKLLELQMEREKMLMQRRGQVEDVVPGMPEKAAQPVQQSVGPAPWYEQAQQSTAQQQLHAAAAPAPQPQAQTQTQLPEASKPYKTGFFWRSSSPAPSTAQNTPPQTPSPPPQAQRRSATPQSQIQPQPRLPTYAEFIEAWYADQQQIQEKGQVPLLFEQS